MSQFEIRSRTLEFESSRTPDGRPVRFENFLLNFGSRQLGQARVGIKSFQFSFHGGDHKLRSISLRFDRPEIVYSDTTAVWGVRLSGWAGIRDHGNYDDYFSGRVSVVVFAR